MENSEEMVKNKDFYHNKPYIKEEKTCGIRYENSAELVLPDYMGDVKRLLKFTARAVPTSKYVTSSEATFLGEVCYRVMYLDSEDKLTEAALSSEYEYEMRLSEDHTDASLETEVQSVSVRLVGPRKITARASLVHNAYATRECEKIYDGLTEEFETRRAGCKIHTARYLASDERELADELGRLEGVSADEVSVIKCDLSATVKNAVIDNGSVELKCEGLLCAILCVDGQPLRLERKIAFEEALPCDPDVPSDAFVRADAYCVSSSVNVNNENSAEGAGCYAAVVMSAIIECHARLDYNLPYTVVTDAFLPGANTECEYEELGLSELVYCNTENKPFLTEASKKEWGVEKLRDIIECDAFADEVRAEAIDGGFSVCAQIIFTVIARTHGDDSYLSLRCPLEYKRVVRADLCGALPQVRLSVFDPKLTHEGDKLFFSCDVTEKVVCERESSQRAVKHASVSVRDGAGGYRVNVLYSVTDESLFDIAKKYAVRCSDIVKRNTDLFGDIGADDYEKPIGEMKRIVVIEK